MTDKRKNKFILDEPIIVLNGLVTDKTEYSHEQIKEFLKNKKNIYEKKSKNVSSPKKARKKIENNNREIINNNNIIMLSEDSDSNEIPKSKKNVKSPKKAKNKRMKKNKSTDEEENLFSSNSVVKKKKSGLGLGDYKLKKNKINEAKKSNLIVEDDEEKGEEDDEEVSSHNYNKKKIKDFFSFKSSIIEEDNSKPIVNYKTVKESNNYLEIRDKCKDQSCTYISLLDSSELKSIIENSAVSQFFKKIKNDGKENIIISEQNQEKNLINALDEIINSNDKKYKLFQKLKPDYNNILVYMPSDYSGINSFGFMNIISYNEKDEIKFITKFFKDKTNKYILKFRKYILNLSYFKSNDDDDNIIYHIIIPKKNLKLIDINFNEKMGLNDLLCKLNCEYYFFAQQPGELLIVEPGSLHLSYYKKSKNNDKQDKNFLLMFWNKMNIDSFYDFLTLKNDCLSEGYKYFPILTMLFNLINKKIKDLSEDSIKTIREIYNDMDSYENINKYIKEINDNNISLHKLFLKNIDLCNICQQEIFNFYVYYYNKEIEENSDYNYSSSFICINCAYKKKYFSIQKSIIFFKYPKEDLDFFIDKIFTYINKNKNSINNIIYEYNYENNEEIISNCFDLYNRKNDCINVDEFLLKLDGPLKIIDKENKINNFLSNKNVKVDKYLKFIENDNINDSSFIDPLNKNNFTNQATNDDIFEIFKAKDYHPFNNNNINMTSVIDNLNPNVNGKDERMNASKYINLNEEDNNINNSINNVDNINSFSLFKNKEKDDLLEQANNNNESIINPFIHKENYEGIQIQSKKKKKKVSTLSDLIAGGKF